MSQRYSDTPSGDCIGHFLKVTLAFPPATADLTQLSPTIDKHFYYNDLQTWRNLQTISNMLMDKSFDNQRHTSYLSSKSQVKEVHPLCVRSTLTRPCSFPSNHVCSQLIYSLQKKEKKRFGYTFKKNAEVDAADLQLYEPVERVPPFSRKTLVTIINHPKHSSNS